MYLSNHWQQYWPYLSNYILGHWTTKFILHLNLYGLITVSSSTLPFFMFCGLHNKFISTYLLYYIIDHWLKLPKYVAEQIRPVGQSLPSDYKQCYIHSKNHICLIGPDGGHIWYLNRVILKLFHASCNNTFDCFFINAWSYIS